MSEKNDTLIDVIKVLVKWKKTIFRVVLLAAIVSVITSLLLPVYYESTTTYLVASNDLSMPEPVGARLKVKEFYGDDDDINRSIAIANSSELISFMIDSFNLMETYDINPDSKKAKYTVKLKFLKHFDVKKTKLDAIELSVESQSPEKAKAMALAARNKISELSKKVVKSAQFNMLEAMKMSMNGKKIQIDTLAAELRIVREKYKIYNVKSQSEILSEELTSTSNSIVKEKARLSILSKMPGVRRDTLSFLRAKIVGLEQGLENNKKNLKLFNQGLGKLVLLETSFKVATKQFHLDEERYKQLEVAYNNNNQVLFVVEDADIPIIKSRPKRSLIVIGSILAALLFSILGVLLLDFYKDVDWKKVANSQ